MDGGYLSWTRDPYHRCAWRASDSEDSMHRGAQLAWVRPRHDCVWVETSQLRAGKEPLRKRFEDVCRTVFSNCSNFGYFQRTNFGAHSSNQQCRPLAEGASGMVRVAIPTTGSGYPVISGGNIHSAAHLIPEDGVLATRHCGRIVNHYHDSSVNTSTTNVSIKNRTN